MFTADTWWILALTLWLATGLVRALVGLEKPASFYAHNSVFWVKMAVVAAIYIIELWPMATLLQWGFWRRRGRPFALGDVPARLARLSEIQAALLLVALALASAMARGWGAQGGPGAVPLRK